METPPNSLLMTPKILITVLVIVLGAGYIIGWIGDPFLFVCFFPIAFLILCALALAMFCLAARHFISRGSIKARKLVMAFMADAAIIPVLFMLATKEHGIVPAAPTSHESLKSLPYLSYVTEDRDVNKNGVVLYDRNLSGNGINIFNLCGIPRAYLMDMSGNVLHAWQFKEPPKNWHHVELCDDGSLLVLVEDAGLLKLNLDSSVKWGRKKRVHHDIDVAENGDIYALARKDELFFKFGLPVPVINDYLVVLSSSGRIKKEISFFKILKREIEFKEVLNIYRWLLRYKNLRSVIEQKRSCGLVFPSMANVVPDIFHVNTVELIDEDIDDVFKKGRIIFCSRKLDLIGIMDIKEERLVWAWGKGRLEKPHHPTLLENRNILLFDNGSDRGYSRIMELDPLTEKVVWEYKASPPELFFSSLRGSSQRLPNGNTLIAESDRGRAFEVTKNGKIVWEFYNPIKYENGKRTTIYRMMRITNPEDYPFLQHRLKRGSE